MASSLMDAVKAQVSNAGVILSFIRLIAWQVSSSILSSWWFKYKSYMTHKTFETESFNWFKMYTLYNNNNNNNNNNKLLLLFLTAIGLSPGGSGYTK